MADTNILSNLPEDITELILKHLPLKDAVKTSILSKDWRYRWTTLPCLVFTEDCSPSARKDNRHFLYRTEEDIERIRAELISIVNHVLLLHTGSIQEFRVRVPCPALEVDHWIRRVSQSSVMELEIKVFYDSDDDTEETELTEVPCSLFTCGSLTLLGLKFCKLKPPPSFNGFKNLKTLNFMWVYLTEDTFESLLFGCPLLENLTAHIETIKNVKINSPKLRYLQTSGKFENISFGGTHAQLSVVSIGFDLDPHLGVESNFTQIFTKLPGIESLGVEFGFLRYLCGGLIPERLPTPYYDLHTLTIHMDLSSAEDGLGALCILRSLPNLTTLDITCVYLEKGPLGEMDWLDKNKCSCALDKLRTVVLYRPTCKREQLDFIKFVLMNSPALEKMIIHTRYQSRTNIVLQEMPSFKASTRAEIVCEEDP